MDRKAGTKERDVLTRIGALLLALAALAESAAGGSRRVRWLLLCCLCQADAVARDFVRGALSDTAGSAPEAMPARYDPAVADPMTLAMSLRSLALVVCAMAAHVPPPAHAHVAGGLWRHPRHDVLRRILGTAFPVERRDSS